MINIEIKDRARLEAAFAHAPSIMMKHLRNSLHRGAQELARAERLAAPKAHSPLTKSIIPHREDALHYRVAPGVAYAPDVEFGTDPGLMPAVEHILDWVKIKNIQPDHADMRPRDLAYMIARGIRDHGVTANPFFYPTAEKETPHIRQLVSDALDAGMVEAFG